MKKPLRLVEGVILSLTAVLVLGTSQDPVSNSWTLGANLTGTDVLLDETTPDLILDVDLEVSPTTIAVSDAMLGTLSLEVTLTWTPPVGDPTLPSPEVVVGLAQSSFAPEGQARAVGVPGADPLVLLATRGALTACDIGTGCVERYRVHFLASQVPAGGSLLATWTLLADVEGFGRDAPPPGVTVSVVEVIAVP